MKGQWLGAGRQNVRQCEVLKRGEHFPFFLLSLKNKSLILLKLLLCFVNAKSLLNICPEVTWEVCSQARTWIHISWIPQDRVTSENFSSRVAVFWTNWVLPHIPQYLFNACLQIIKPFTFPDVSTVSNSSDSCWCHPPAQAVPGLLRWKQYFCATTCQIFFLYEQGGCFPGRALSESRIQLCKLSGRCWVFPSFLQKWDQ